MEIISNGTRINPHITHDPTLGEIVISGWSFSEKPELLYHGLCTILDGYIEQQMACTVHIRLNCFNTSSMKWLVLVASKLRQLPPSPKTACIWFFDPTDEETKEWGEDVSRAADYPFIYTPLPGHTILEK
jgi:hypothetical protein